MKKLLLLACGGLAITGCDHYSSRLASIEPVNDPPPQQVAYYYNEGTDVAQISPAAGEAVIDDRTFGQYLRNEYIKLAKYEHDEAYDYRAAKYYMDKIDALGKGIMVSPASFHDFEISEDRLETLTAAREELLHSLKTYQSPENRYSLAKAQSRFDCWMERAEESDNRQKSQQCRAEFREAIDSLTPSLGMDLSFVIPFEAGSNHLSDEARNALGSALNQWRVRQSQGDNQLVLSPSTILPRDESDRQIAIIRSILEYNGIAPEKIVVSQDQTPSDAFNVTIRQAEMEEAAQEVLLEAPPVL